MHFWVFKNQSCALLFCRCCWQLDEIHAQEKLVWTKSEWISMKGKDRCLCTTHCWVYVMCCNNSSGAETPISLRKNLSLVSVHLDGRPCSRQLHFLPWYCYICFFVAEISISNSWEKKVSISFFLDLQVHLSFFQPQGFLGSVSCSLYSLFLISLLLSPLGTKISLFIQVFRAVSFVHILM